MAANTQKLELREDQQTIVFEVAERLHQDPQAVLDSVIEELEESAILTQSEAEIDEGQGIDQESMNIFFQEMIDKAQQRIATQSTT
ncbi:MAG: hypothetical protein GKR95_07510 [Gammaproteobacteria bacterium]|nr:hypothetical protein [Kiritimatiellia bacterium]NKB61978.1 hypothetical protein [Gammaproteobacteria bacterium]